MWFVTLALLVVAGYLLYDAIRDYSNKPHEISTAHKRSGIEPSNTSHHYINTGESRDDGSIAQQTTDDSQLSTAPTVYAAAAVPRASIDVLRHGSIKARDSIRETIKAGTTRYREDSKDSVSVSGSSTTSEIVDGPVKITDVTKQIVGSGTLKFKDSLEQSIGHAKFKFSTERDTASVTEGQSTFKDVVATGAMRFKESIGSSWSHRESSLADSTSDRNGVANQISELKETASSGATRFKNSLGETFNTTKSSSVVTGAEPSETLNTESGGNTDSPSGASGVRGSAPAGKKGVEGSADSETAGEIEKRTFLDKPQGEKDDLTKVKGIGPAIEEHLNEMGVYHFHQLAKFDQADIDYVNEELHFPGRIERDDWIKQASALVGKS